MIPVEKFDDRNWLWLKLFIGRGGAGANRRWATGPLKKNPNVLPAKIWTGRGI